jgi:hypothetical protein
MSKIMIVISLVYQLPASIAKLGWHYIKQDGNYVVKYKWEITKPAELLENKKSQIRTTMNITIIAF